MRTLHAGEVAGSIPGGNSVKIFVECRGCQSDHRGCASSVSYIFGGIPFRYVLL
jgi:hypothetical protein